MWFFHGKLRLRANCGWRRSILRQLHYSCFFPQPPCIWGALRSLHLTSRILTPSSQVLSNHHSTSPSGPEAVRGGLAMTHRLSSPGCALTAAGFRPPLCLLILSGQEWLGEALQHMAHLEGCSQNHTVGVAEMESCYWQITSRARAQSARSSKR